MYSGRKWSIFLLRRLDCYWTLGACKIFSPCCLHPHFLENGKTCCSKNNRKLLCLTYRFTDLLAALSTVSIAAIRSFKTLSSRFPHFVSNIMLPLEVAPQSHLNRHTSGVSSPYTVSGVSHSQQKNWVGGKRCDAAATWKATIVQPVEKTHQGEKWGRCTEQRLRNAFSITPLRCVLQQIVNTVSSARTVKIIHDVSAVVLHYNDTNQRRSLQAQVHFLVLFDSFPPTMYNHTGQILFTSGWDEWKRKR